MFIAAGSLGILKLRRKRHKHFAPSELNFKNERVTINISCLRHEKTVLLSLAAKPNQLSDASCATASLSRKPARHAAAKLRRTSHP